MPPLSINEFDLIEPLYSGGAAEVWRGVHRRQGIPVAVKILLGEAERNAGFLLALHNEVRAIAGLDHPNIVTIFDYGELPASMDSQAGHRLKAGSPFLVLEFASRGTLAGWPGPHPWRVLNTILLALLDALAHAHARGVVHLDLKPDNVLLFGDPSSTPHLKLTDFGIAQAQERRGRSRTEGSGQEVTSQGRRDRIAGTPLYMAPEQFIGDWQEFGPWTDLYALGWLAYELAAGAHPYHDMNLFQMADAQRTRPPPPLVPGHPMPPGFVEWVMMLLEKRPEDRYQRAHEAARALRELDLYIPGGLNSGGSWEDLRTALVSAPVPGVGGVALPSVHAASTLAARMAGPAAASASVPFAPPASAPSTAGRPTPGQGSSEDHTALLSLEEMSMVAHQAMPRPVPVLPRTWRSPGSMQRPLSILGAGLSLFGLRSTPLVDRERERDQIWETLRTVYDGGGARLVLLHGPAGAGRTRLVEWIAERAHEVGGATVLKAVHSAGLDPHDGLGPMVARHFRCLNLPRQEVLERVSRVLERDGIRDDYETGALTELIAPLHAQPLESLSAGWEGGRTTMVVQFSSPVERYTVLQRLLDRLAAERPLLVCIDDAQWASDALGFASHVLRAQALSPSRIIFLLAAQDEALADRPIEAGQLDALSNLDRTLRVPVPPLQPADHLSLVQTMLGLEAGVAAQVARRTAGNPLFALQVVGDWVQRGALELSPRGFVLRPGHGVTLPDDLYQVWSARMDRALEGAPTGMRQALELAAALGQTVDQREWEDACRQAGLPQPVQLVERLAAHRLVRFAETQDPHFGRPVGWSFAHGMLRECLERGAREAGRWDRHHRACAAMLRERYPLRHRLAGERVARHLLAAGRLEEALEPLLLAAESRREASEQPQAHTLLDQRDTLLKRLGISEEDSRWGDGWVLRAQLFIDQSKVDAAALAAAQVEQSAREYEWTRLLPIALEMRGFTARWRGDTLLADELCRLALARFRELGDMRGVARCLSRGLAQNAVDRGDLRDASRLYREALELNRKLGDLHMQSYCLLSLGLLSNRARRLKRAEVLIDRAVALSDRTGNQLVRADGLRLLGQIAFTRGQAERAAGLIEQARVIYDQKGAQLGVAASYADLGDTFRSRSRLEEAEQHYRRALSLYEAIGTRHGFTLRIGLGHLFLAQERFDAAQETLAPCLAEFAQAGKLYYLGATHAALLPCAAAARDWSAWKSHLIEATALFDMSQMVEPDDARAVQLAGDLALRVRETARAVQAYTFALKLWRSVGKAEQVAEVEQRLARAEGILAARTRL